MLNYFPKTKHIMLLPDFLYFIYGPCRCITQLHRLFHSQIEVQKFLPCYESFCCTYASYNQCRYLLASTCIIRQVLECGILTGVWPWALSAETHWEMVGCTFEPYLCLLPAPAHCYQLFAHGLPRANAQCLLTQEEQYAKPSQLDADRVLCCVCLYVNTCLENPNRSSWFQTLTNYCGFCFFVSFLCYPTQIHLWCCGIWCSFYEPHSDCPSFFFLVVWKNVT